MQALLWPAAQAIVASRLSGCPSPTPAASAGAMQGAERALAWLQRIRCIPVYAVYAVLVPLRGRSSVPVAGLRLSPGMAFLPPSRRVRRKCTG